MQEKLEKIIHLFYHNSYTCFVEKAVILNENLSSQWPGSKKLCFQFHGTKITKTYINRISIFLLSPNLLTMHSCTGEKNWEVKILRHPKTSSLLVIVMSCPQIGSLSSSTANQRAAQNNYRALGYQDLYFLNFVTCN